MKKALLLTVVALLASARGEAAEIKVLATVGMQPATPQLFAQFEAATGHRVVVTYGLAAVLKTKFLEGAPADVLILTAPIIEDLAKQGKVVTDSKKDVARSGVGVGVKAGAPKPDISTPAAFKQALIAAKSIAFSRSGASGIHFANLIGQLGIADDVARKARIFDGVVGQLAANGEVEIAVQQVSELKLVGGIDIVGALPESLQKVTVFTAGVFVASARPAAAGLLIEALRTPTVATVMRKQGLEPIGSAR